MKNLFRSCWWVINWLGKYWQVGISSTLCSKNISFVYLFCAGNAFHDYSEQPITFFPSYKYDLNSNVYDTSQKRRTPSWTVSYWSIQVICESVCVCLSVRIVYCFDQETMEGIVLQVMATTAVIPFAFLIIGRS